MQRSAAPHAGLSKFEQRRPTWSRRPIVFAGRGGHSSRCSRWPPSSQFHPSLPPQLSMARFRAPCRGIRHRPCSAGRTRSSRPGSISPPTGTWRRSSISPASPTRTRRQARSSPPTCRIGRVSSSGARPPRIASTAPSWWSGRTSRPATTWTPCGTVGTCATATRGSACRHSASASTSYAAGARPATAGSTSPAAARSRPTSSHTTSSRRPARSSATSWAGSRPSACSPSARRNPPAG